MFDIFVLLVIIAVTTHGLWRGAIRELFHTVALIVSLTFSNLGFLFLSQLFENVWIDHPIRKKMLCFLVIFLLLEIGFYTLDIHLQKKNKRKLIWRNRYCGALVAFCRILILLTCVIIPLLHIFQKKPSSSLKYLNKSISLKWVVRLESWEMIKNSRIAQCIYEVRS